MSAARRTQNGASANAKRTPSKKKGRSQASSRRAPSRGKSSKRPAERRSRRLTLVFLVCLGVFIAAVWTLYPVLRLQYQQQREVASLEAELEGLKERNTELAEQIERLQTPEGVEEVARQDLGLVKDGETGYVVTGVEDPDLDADAVNERTRSTLDEDVPLWTKVLDVLFGVR